MATTVMGRVGWQRSAVDNRDDVGSSQQVRQWLNRGSNDDWALGVGNIDWSMSTTRAGELCDIYNKLLWSIANNLPTIIDTTINTTAGRTSLYCIKRLVLLNINMQNCKEHRHDRSRILATRHDGLGDWAVVDEGEKQQSWECICSDTM